MDNAPGAPPRWRRQSIEGIQPGTVFSFSRTFTEQDVAAFGAVTRDFNPVHYDQRFARSRGFSGLIAHGLLVGSMVCELGGQLAWLASGMSFRFLRPVYLGDPITCTVTIAEVHDTGKARAEAVFTDPEGARVMECQLHGYLPGRGDRELLSRLVEEGDVTNGLRETR